MKYVIRIGASVLMVASIVVLSLLLIARTQRGVSVSGEIPTFGYDDGIVSALANNRYTELNLAKTSNENIKISLVRAYADKKRIVIEYVLESDQHDLTDVIGGSDTDKSYMSANLLISDDVCVLHYASIVDSQTDKLSGILCFDSYKLSKDFDTSNFKNIKLEIEKLHGINISQSFGFNLNAFDSQMLSIDQDFKVGSEKIKLIRAERTATTTTIYFKTKSESLPQSLILKQHGKEMTSMLSIKEINKDVQCLRFPCVDIEETFSIYASGQQLFEGVFDNNVSKT